MSKWSRALIWAGFLAVQLFSREQVFEEDAFWAYEDGMIAYEELEELLAQIGEDDREACALWAAFGGDPCDKTLGEKLDDLNFHGRAKYSSLFDSSGGRIRERLNVETRLQRFTFSVRASRDADGFHLGKWRALYRDKKSFSALGYLSGADIFSALSLDTAIGSVVSLRAGKFRWGSSLMTDSSAGILGGFEGKNLSVGGFASAARGGFRHGFFRIRLLESDMQLTYSDGWKSPLFYFGAASKGKSPKVRLRAYFHQNDDFPGIFHVPSMVQKNGSVIDLSARIPVGAYALRLGFRSMIPLEMESEAKTVSEGFFVRNSGNARAEIGGRLKSFGDSLDFTAILKSGVRLFAAESLFAEWKFSPRSEFETSPYEIRPGILLLPDAGVRVKGILILRGPEKKPLVLREETVMKIGGLDLRSTLEMRGDKIREFRLWRFGLSAGGTW